MYNKYYDLIFLLNNQANIFFNYDYYYSMLRSSTLTKAPTNEKNDCYYFA